MQQNRSRRGSRRLVIIFSVLLVLVILVVLTCTLFNLKTIEVKFDSDYHASLTQEEVLTSCNVFQGKNLLFLSEREMAEAIRRGNRYAKDVSIERQFPSRVVVHLSERMETFSVRLFDEESKSERYFMFDIAGVALRTDTQNRNNFDQTKQNIMVRGITNDDLVEGTFAVGSPLQTYEPAKIDCVKSVLGALKLYGYDEYAMRDFVREIDMTNLRSVKLYAGPAENLQKFVVELDSAYENVDNQMRTAIGLWNALSDVQHQNGKIVLVKNANSPTGYDATYRNSAV